MEAARTAGNHRKALRHHRRAARALAVVSRFLLEATDSESSAQGTPPDHRLRMRLARLAARLEELARVIGDLDLAVDVEATRALARGVHERLEAADHAGARRLLATLRTALEDLSESIDEARDLEHEQTENAQP